MAAKLEKTSVPGVYKRGGRHVFTYRDAEGVQRWESRATFDLARRGKSARETDVDRGEHEPMSRITLHSYLREWIERYMGTGRRGFREETRDEYRALIEKYMVGRPEGPRPFFSSRMRLTGLSARKVAEFIGWLTRQPGRRSDHLSDKSVRNIFGVLSAAMASAQREGLIRHDPTLGAALPYRPEIEDEEEDRRPFPRVVVDGEDEPLETMERVIRLVADEHRLMFELLGVTGVRRSELLPLEGRHLARADGQWCIRIRQRVRRKRGKGLVVGPLKSKFAKRTLPIPDDVGDRLAALKRGARELLFQSQSGGMLDPDNLAARVLVPACKAAGVPWAGFHTFRHTVASRLFEEGRNIVQVQKWLGHHAPSFTLDTYVHLLKSGLGGSLALIEGGANDVQTEATGSDGNPDTAAR